MAYNYSPLEEAKYGNTDTDGYNCGEEPNMQTDAAMEDDLVGHSMDFRRPKVRLVRSVMTGCLNLKKNCYAATRFVFKLAFGRWPSALLVLLIYIGLTVAFSVIALTGKYHEFRKDISLNSFMVPDIKVSSDFAAFNAAKDQAKGSSMQTFENIFKPSSCLGNDIGSSPNKKLTRRMKHSRHKRDNYLSSSGKDEQYLRQIGWTLDLVYVAKGSKKELNIFTRERLLAIHNIEIKLMKHLGYKDHCYKWEILGYLDKSVIPYGNCTPPNSITGFFFPSKPGIFDGLGDTIRPIRDTLNYLQTEKEFFSYVSTDYNPKTKTSRILRAQILFGKPVAGVSLTEEAQKAEFKKYLRTYIQPLKKMNTNEKVSVLYGGGDLFDYLVEQALLSDLRLALISLILIIILLLILTFSLWLTFMAILSIVSSVAVAYFFYHVVFGIKYMGILNGVSLFVIIGIGVDDIFVFINTFRQAVDNKDLGDRIYHTISVAGKATLFTSFTTAAAFAANALSPIPAIHDFGVFMAILVASCWVSVLFIMSSALSLWNAGIEKLESAMCHKMLSLIGLRRSARLRLPDDIRQFLSGNTVDNDLEELPDYTPCSPDHLELQSLIDDDDEPMLVIDNETALTAEQSTDSLGFRLQSILYHYVAVPVIKARVAVLVVYLILFCTSIFLMTKLKVSTEQPKFFKADSNLQRWLELPDVSLSTQMSMDWVGEMENHIPGYPRPTFPPLVRRTTQNSRRSTKVGTPPRHKWHTTPKSRVPSQGTTKATTKKPTEVTTNPPVTRHTIFTRHQKTTLKPTTSSPLTRQIHERTTYPTAPAWLIDTESTTKFPVFVTTDKNGMLPGNNRTRTTVHPYEPCANHNCVHGQCKVKNGSAICHCWTPYAGDLCSVDCPVRTMQGNCCAIPFTYKSTPQYGCLIEGTKKSWCYDRSGKKGYCNTTVENQCEIRTLTPNKTCCTFPFVYKMVQYYYCIPDMNGIMSCGIQRHVSSLSDLLPCNITKHDISPTVPKLCPKPDSCKVAKKPTDGSTAMVYLVFGIKGIDKNSIDRRHVLKETLGKVMYDDKFLLDMSCDTANMMKSACKICKKIAANTDLVLPGGADCFPPYVRLSLMKHFPGECQDLPIPHSSQGASDNAKSHSVLVMKDNTKLEWFAMAFSSTTGKLSSFGTQQKDYMKWDKFVKEVLSASGTPDTLKDGYLTSETWVKMFSGMIVVDSAVYGIAVSLVLCLAAIIIFTGHALLFVILFLTILGVLSMVTAIFYLTGWQLGGVEAVSLSILVGTSVDYCFHLVEAYILAGEAVRPSLDAKKSRQWRAKAAMSHIGMSIISSGITTILAAIPLCLAQIQLFAKFGLIVTINTGISLLYTMTVTMAMLGTFGPAKFRASIRACVIGASVVAILCGVVALIVYLVSTHGYCIPSPRGTPLFKC